MNLRSVTFLSIIVAAAISIFGFAQGTLLAPQTFDGLLAASAQALPTATLTVSPTNSTAPVTVSISGVVNTDSSCAEGRFVVFFGDSTTSDAAPAYNLTVPAGTCASQAFSTTHRYTIAPRVNSVSVWKRDASGVASIFQTSKEVTITPATTPTPPAPAPATTTSPTLTVTPTKGTVPLTVSITAIANTDNSCAEGKFVIFLGDGSVGYNFTVPAGTCGPKTFTVSHTYTVGGKINTVSLWKRDASNVASINVANKDVTVTPVITLATTTPSISVTPQSGTFPLTVSITAIANTDNSCAEGKFVIFLGDGSVGYNFTVPAGTCGPKTHVVSHTYERVGVNTISLWKRDGAGALATELARPTQDVVVTSPHMALTWPGQYAKVFNRPAHSPQLSDVILSSRWERPSTAQAIRDFFGTRIDWNYSYQSNGAFIKSIINGTTPFTYPLGYSGTINGQIPDGLDALKTTRLKGRDISAFGVPYTLPALKIDAPKVHVGDLSSPDYQGAVLTTLKNYIDHGTRLIQIDDAGFQYNWVLDTIDNVRGGYGTSSLLYFTRDWMPAHIGALPLSWGFPSNFYSLSDNERIIFFRNYAKQKAGNLSSGLPTNLLQDEFYAFHKSAFMQFMALLSTKAKEYAHGARVSFSCNNSSFQFFGDEVLADYAGVAPTLFPLKYCNFFNGELTSNTNRIYSSAEPEHIWSRARYMEAHGLTQIFNPPKLALNYTTQNAEVVTQTRKVIAFAYALGSWMVIPWDVYVPGVNQSGLPEDQSRYFGTPAEYADLYRFIRANASSIDGYEQVYDTSSPVGGSDVVFNTPTVKGKVWVKDLPMSIGTFNVEPVSIPSSGRAYAFVRAKPESKTAPAVVHLVNYSETTPIQIEFVNAFFGWSHTVPITLELRTPGSYSAAVSPDFRSQTLTGTLVNGKTTFLLSGVTDYGLLVVPPQ